MSHKRNVTRYKNKKKNTKAITEMVMKFNEYIESPKGKKLIQELEQEYVDSIFDNFAEIKVNE